MSRIDPKAFALATTKGLMAVGFCGSFRFGQILACMALPEDEQRDAYQYVVRQFVPAVRAELRSHGSLRAENGIEAIPDSSSALVVYRRRIFAIHCDLQVEEPQGRFHSVGSGCQIAQGAMAVLTGRRAPTPKDAAAAIRIASRFVHNVAGPVRTVFAA
jgi:hypothetical protein